MVSSTLSSYEFQIGWYSCAWCAWCFAELPFGFSGVSGVYELTDYIFGALGVCLSCPIWLFYFIFCKSISIHFIWRVIIYVLNGSIFLDVRVGENMYLVDQSEGAFVIWYIASYYISSRIRFISVFNILDFILFRLHVARISLLFIFLDLCVLSWYCW